MKKINGLKRLLFLAVIVGLLVGATSAGALGYSSAKQACQVIFGGHWLGDVNAGTCYWKEPSCATFPSATGMYFVAELWYDAGTVFGILTGVCVPAPTLNQPNIDLVKGVEEGGTASAKDWHVDYPAGACDETPCRLTVGHTTNSASKGSLPGMVDSVYYKTDSADPYKVCYDGGDANALYQFVSGEWVPVPFTWYGDSICTTATGPGAFAAVSE